MTYFHADAMAAAHTQREMDMIKQTDWKARAKKAEANLAALRAVGNPTSGDLISREAALAAVVENDVIGAIRTLRALPSQQAATPDALTLESAEMPYRIFTDSSRVWLDDDDGGSLFAYVRESALPSQQAQDLSAITRLVVIDHREEGPGSVFEAWRVSVNSSIQDDGKTLKIFATAQKGGA